jgi:hypothetical protein
MNDDAVAKLLDEAAIRNLVARLAHMADLAEDLTPYYALWTEDGVYEVRNPIGWKPGDRNLAKKVSGHAELKKDRDMLRSTGFQGPDTDVWHLNTTLAVTVHDQDSAEAESYWVVVHGRNKPFILPRYIQAHSPGLEDSLSSRDSQWRKSRHRHARTPQSNEAAVMIQASRGHPGRGLFFQP